MKRAIAFALLAASAAPAFAAATPPLESGLQHAMQLKKGTDERTGTSGKAIQAYMQAGLIDKKPNQRADYTDYYLLKQPASFLGHELVLIEEEYMAQYIGCCVSPGVGVTVRVYGSTQNLARFARSHRCSLTEHVDFAHELRDVAIRNKVPKGHYASLSCRERDAQRDES